MELEVVCRSCGKSYTPIHHDYEGTWRTCPPCRKPASKPAHPRGGSAP